VRTEIRIRRRDAEASAGPHRREVRRPDHGVLIVIHPARSPSRSLHGGGGTVEEIVIETLRVPTSGSADVARPDGVELGYVLPTLLLEVFVKGHFLFA
jgi:hypothetical protein